MGHFFMKFSISRTYLQACIVFALCPSVAAQQNAPPRAQSTLPKPASPVLVPEMPAPDMPPASRNVPRVEQQADVPTVTPPPAVATRPVKRKGPIDALKPGQFVWERHDAYEGPMKIVAVLDIQRMYVFQNDKLIGFTTISSGKKGKETPTGVFNILQKNVDHKSNLYSNAPMPFMQRLTWDGIAMHGGQLPGYPASHGCIRLPHAFAKALFDVTLMDQEVVVLQDAATPVKRPEPKPLPVVEPPVISAEPVIDPAIVPPASPPKPIG